VGGACRALGEIRNSYKILFGKPEWKRPVGRPERRWEVNTVMDPAKWGCKDFDWINLCQDRDRW
jgi:hypothetical protein